MTIAELLPARREGHRKKAMNSNAAMKSAPSAILESGDDSEYDPNEKQNARKTAKKTASPKQSKQRKKKVQSTLDFPIVKAAKIAKPNKCGPSTCAECGMLYYAGRDEDDSTHSKFHKSFMSKFNNSYQPQILSPFIVWNAQQIADNAPYFVDRQNEGKQRHHDDEKKKKKKYKQMKIGRLSSTLEERKEEDEVDRIRMMERIQRDRHEVILCVDYEQFVALKQKHSEILSVCDLMDRDLGYFTTKQWKHAQYLKRTQMVFVDAEQQAVDGDVVYSLDENQSLYCFVESTGHQIIGCVVCEPRQFAYNIKQSESRDWSEEHVEREQEEQQCYIGIVKIWVHAQHRRKCIASALMDCIRSTFIYGTRVQKQYIGWCQPTRIGRHFAQKYCQTNNILVY